MLDASITHSYLSASLNDNKKGLEQSLSILPVVAQPNVTKDEIIQVAQQRYPNSIEPFEKDGYTWVGMLGLKFNQNGKLIAVKRAWEL